MNRLISNYSKMISKLTKIMKLKADRVLELEKVF